MRGVTLVQNCAFPTVDTASDPRSRASRCTALKDLDLLVRFGYKLVRYPWGSWSSNLDAQHKDTVVRTSGVPRPQMQGQPSSCGPVNQRGEYFTPFRPPLLTPFQASSFVSFSMDARPLVARARSLGGTNLVVSGILTDYKELSCNNSIWNLDAVRFANVQERVLCPYQRRLERMHISCSSTWTSYTAPGRPSLLW